METKEKTLFIQVVKKYLKLDETTIKKTRNSINEKSPKIGRKNQKENQSFVRYIMLCTMLCRGENHLQKMKNLENLARQMEKKTRYKF